MWVTDGQGAEGKGHQVFKFSPDGKVLLTLGTAGVAGASPTTFNQPSDVVVAANGDIFVADGHGGESNGRIVKFSKDGRFIKTWGRKGTGQGDSIFRTPSRSIRRAACSSATAATAASRSSIRKGRSSRSGTSSGARAASSSMRNDTIYVDRLRVEPEPEPRVSAGAARRQRARRIGPSIRADRQREPGGRGRRAGGVAADAEGTMLRRRDRRPGHQGVSVKAAAR